PYISACWTPPGTGAASSSTVAGPSVCQASEIAKKTRSGFVRWTAACPKLPRTRPAAVSSGTIPGGSRSSIGTRTMYDGTTYPAPIGNCTMREEIAYRSTSRPASSGSIPCELSAATASGIAKRRNSADAPVSTSISRRLARWERASHESSIRRSTAPVERTSSMTRWVMAGTSVGGAGGISDLPPAPPDVLSADVGVDGEVVELGVVGGAGAFQPRGGLIDEP